MKTPTSAQLARLAEALFRFSAGIDTALAPHVRSVAVELAGAIAASDQEGIRRALGRAHGVVELGKQVGIIAASDASVIAGAIARSHELALPEPSPEPEAEEEMARPSISAFEKIAAEPDAAAAKPRDENPAATPEATPAVKDVEAAPVAAVSPVAGSGKKEVQAPSTAGERRRLIVETIRQNPNARMRDLLAALGSVSERTIRYDLERLVSSGKIDREGVGGPATWYRVRQGVTTH